MGGTKNWQHVFHTRQIQHLHIEFGNESQMVLLLRRNGGRNAPQLKSMTFTKMAKMPDCCMCSQQFTIKRGVTRLRVSQFSGKETKWSPMVSRFLLHDAADISIGGVSGKRKFSLWDEMSGGYRHSCILESLLCRSGPFQRLGPPPSRDQSKGATPVRNCAENGSKNSPCQENVAIV